MARALVMAGAVAAAAAFASAVPHDSFAIKTDGSSAAARRLQAASALNGVNINGLNVSDVDADGA